MTVRLSFIRLWAGASAIVCAGLFAACSNNKVTTAATGSAATGSGGSVPTGATTGTTNPTTSGSGTQCGVCGGGQICDSTLGCVECVINSDCKDPAAPICVTGRCEACGVSADCGAGRTCDASHQCRMTCTTNANCTQGGNNICDTMTGACVQCLSQTDCNGTGMPLCNNGRCVDCVTSTDCGVAAPICDAVNGRCVECLLTSQCKQAGAVCDQHMCVQGCTGNQQCAQMDPQNPVCDLASGQCVECLMGADCPVPHHCLQNQCVQCIVSTDCMAPTPLCTMNGRCVQCISAMDCTAGQQCHNGQCQTPGG